MLGEQIAELKGKTTGQRVLDVEGPTIETVPWFHQLEKLTLFCSNKHARDF